jgi:hypothetical protein
MMLRNLLIVFIAGLLPQYVFSQTASVYGNIRNESNQLLTSVSIKLSSGGKFQLSDQQGNYDIAIPAGEDIVITFSYIGYEDYVRQLNLKTGQRLPLYIVMVTRQYEIDSITIEDRELRDQPSMVKIDPKQFEALPSASGGVEAILKVLGASSNNELSSQYSVRGGNYDENLVYVNDFEIFRPLLIRSGQQEGLSFINQDLVSSLLFSAGGFQAKYGDKMSSVLDIEYKKPDKFGGSAMVSLLGASLSLEGATKNQRFTYLLGARYKTNQYLLNSLETSGDYRPSFSDVQAFFTYQVSKKVSLEGIGNYSSNRYWFIPEDRVTTFGTIQSTLRLTVYFDGQEVDRYSTAMGGLSLTYRPKRNLSLKFLTSVYGDQEDETFDVIGEYFLGEVGNDLGNETFGQTLYYIGTGTNQEWGRDYLDASIVKFAHKGTFLKHQHFVQWGVDINREHIADQLSEWTRMDSAGYTLPYSGSEIFLQEVIRTSYTFSSMRYSAYLQDSWTLNEDRDFVLTYGSRFSYWDLNDQFIVSPRIQLSYQPNWQKDIVFRAAVGAYDQPPFYRELRDLYGNLHVDVLAQRSIHYVIGSDYNFRMWNRPFKFVSEIYYKQLYDLNPYELDNVRIRYFGENNAKGYAAGIDLRLNGEFVKDAESWISLSLLSTKENLNDDFVYEIDTNYIDQEQTEFELDSTIVYPGYIPRPTDQFLNFGMFFQDYIPGNENFKVHLNFLFGTGLPTGPPDHVRSRDTIRLSPYRRVDIGFSALLLNGEKPKIQQSKTWRHFETIWLSLEIFNLLDVSNEISFTWVKDITNTTYAVPNYLTGRRVNLRLMVDF